MEIQDLLKLMVEKNASDLHLKVGIPPAFRVDGDLGHLDLPPQTLADNRKMIYSILTPAQKEKFEKENELDLSHSIPGVSRFRVNVFRQRGQIGAVLRVIPIRIKSVEELGLPEVIKKLCDRPRGLILVTGPTGSGKSTTLAAMIDYINENRRGHIITVEDPIEFLHKDKKCSVNQREVGVDTKSFSEALRRILREDPDVILIGEMRDLETVSMCITMAETGRLVFATLHTTDAAQTVDRIIDVFPPHQQQQIRMQLSANLEGVISMTLLPRKSGKGRVAAFEIMVGTPAVRSLIREGKTQHLYSAIQTGSELGMVSLDQSLKQLVLKDMVNFEEALQKCINIQEFRQMMGMRENNFK